MIEEKQATTFNGYWAIVALLVLQILAVLGIAVLPPFFKVILAFAAVLVFICWFGFFMVHPNQGRVMQLFGSYVGSDRQPGLRWANPLYMKAKVSLRVRNFESGTLKVNDSAGNPIDIAAVVVWKVVDTAEALFEVDDYENYVTIQSEAAVRNLATTHPY
ncbi:MAG: SPFH domain-containing protein, partial [Gammaproteobacteria bacterium]